MLSFHVTAHKEAALRVKQKADHLPFENVVVNTGHVFIPGGHTSSSRGKRSYFPDGCAVFLPRIRNSSPQSSSEIFFHNITVKIVWWSFLLEYALPFLNGYYTHSYLCGYPCLENAELTIAFLTIWLLRAFNMLIYTVNFQENQQSQEDAFFNYLFVEHLMQLELIVCL